MDTKNMAKAVGIGMAAGAALSMMANPRKKQHKNMMMKKSNVSKAIRAMGDVLEDVENALGL